MNQVGYDFLEKEILLLETQPQNSSLLKTQNSSHDPRCLIYQLEYCKQHDATEILNKISCPTRVLSGDKEIVVTESETMYLSNNIKNASHLIIKEADHVLPLNATKQVAEEIDNLAGNNQATFNFSGQFG